MRPAICTVLGVLAGLVATSSAWAQPAEPEPPTVVRIGGTDEATATDVEGAEVRVSAEPALRVTLEQVPFYCAPPPELAASMPDEHTLVLRLLPPEGPVTRCMGLHLVDLLVTPAPANPVTIVVESADGEVLARLAPPGLELPVVRVDGSRVAPPQGDAEVSLSLEATARESGLAIDVADLVTSCSPIPAFTARVVGDTLHLVMTEPSGTVSRCVGPHWASLRIDDVPAEVTTVQLEDWTSAVLGTVSVTR
jgi:hypothetical protein